MLYNPYELIPWINQRSVKGVIHIGAHMCEEKQYYNCFLNITDDRILWVEANPQIAIQAQISNPTVKIVTALCSNEDGKQVEFMITNNGQSSSMLEFGTHTTHHPGVVSIGKQMLTTTTLDTLCKDFEWTKDCNMMNIDVQGAELMVLQGATELLKHIDLIYTEVNIEEVYKGCCLMSDLDRFLEPFGFVRVTTKMTDWNWGDALYQKRLKK